MVLYHKEQSSFLLKRKVSGKKSLFGNQCNSCPSILIHIMKHLKIILTQIVKHNLVLILCILITYLNSIKFWDLALCVVLTGQRIEDVIQSTCFEMKVTCQLLWPISLIFNFCETSVCMESRQPNLVSLTCPILSNFKCLN